MLKCSLLENKFGRMHSIRIELLIYLKVSLPLLTVLTCSNGYDKICPHSSQWNFTSRSLGCADQKIYMCLFDLLTSNRINKTVFTETCGPKDVSKEGSKYILNPNLEQVPCDAIQYQPFTFTTNGNSQCAFGKSLCISSGQILASNESSLADASCRCDYTRGFDYIIPPKDPCSCKSAEEDCSCYIRKCDDDKVMIADYRCVTRVETILPEDIKCPIISRTIPPEETDAIDKKQFQSIPSSQTWSKQALVILSVVVIIFTVLVGLLFFSVPHVTSILLESELKLSVKRKENEFMILNGDNVKIECSVKSYIYVRSVTWQKEIDGEIMEITPSEEKYKLVFGKMPSLIILDCDADDRGKYRCIVRNVVGLRNAMFSSCMNLNSRFGWLTGFVTVLQHIPAFHTEDITLHTYDIDAQSKPTVYNVYKGDNITMEPHFDDQHKLIAVKWFNDERTELDLSNTQYCGGVPDFPSLTIKDTKIDNTGKYVCLLIYGNGETQKTLFKLKIIPPVKIYKAFLEHREDKTFIRPSICDILVKHIQENNIVIISGREGTGKSKICLELASFYDEKDYLIWKVDLSENHTMHTDMVDTLLIIDDHYYTQDSLHAFMEQLLPVLHVRNIKVILTCRNTDLEIVRSVSEINKLKEEALIDINSSLTVEEKDKMIERYLEVYNIATSSSIDSNFRDPIIIHDLSVQVKLDEDAIKMIKNEEPWKGFPLSLSLFCSDRSCLYLGEKYFTNPPIDLVEKLKNLYQIARKTSNCIETITDYCILVYIMNNNYHHLDINDHNLCSQLDELYQTLFHFKNIPEKTGSIEDQKIAIEEAVHRMHNKYLKFHKGFYEFIHPCLLKAMFLSSEPMVHYLLQNGSLQDITEFVRSENYTALENEIVIEIGEEYHHILCERLVSYAFEDHSLLQLVAQYIYLYWRSSGNNLVNRLFKHIEFIIFRSLGVHTDDLLSLNNESISEHRINLEELVQFSKIILLVDELTYKGRDPWIYRPGSADFLILSALISATMGRYATNRNQTYRILLEEFRNRIHLKSFIKLLSKPLDINGNTFFHYLVLFSQMEACKILSVIEARKYIVGTENVKKYTPLDIAAYLGKRNILEDMSLETSFTKKLRDKLDKLVRGGKAMFYDESLINNSSGDADEEKEGKKNEVKKKKNLLKKTLHRIRDRNNKTEKHVEIESESEFIDILCFDDVLINAVEFGGKEDYQLSINLLSKLSLKRYEMLKEL